MGSLLIFLTIVKASDAVVFDLPHMECIRATTALECIGVRYAIGWREGARACD